MTLDVKTFDDGGKTVLNAPISFKIKLNVQSFTLCRYPRTYKSYFLCGDVVMDAVSGPVVARVVTSARTFGLAEAGVVADKSGAAHQEVEQEAEHLHADGDQEEDERVPPLVRDQQLGEDAREGDDHPRRAWGRRRGSGGCEHEGTSGVRGCTHSLRSSPPACSAWAASPCNHRNWTAALGGDGEELYY